MTFEEVTVIGAVLAIFITMILIGVNIFMSWRD